MFSAVAFDLDGTLVRDESSWVKLHRAFGSDPELVNRNKSLFDTCKINCEKWIELDVKLWKKALGRFPTKKEIMDVLLDYELQEGAEEAVERLKENGFYLCIVSSGLDILAEAVAERLGMDSFLGNELFFDENSCLTGKGKCNVNPVEKDKAVVKIANETGIPLQEFVAVGDTKYDATMFEVVGLGIAYNPRDPLTERIADIVVRGNLKKVVNAIFKVDFFK